MSIIKLEDRILFEAGAAAEAVQAAQEVQAIQDQQAEQSVADQANSELVNDAEIIAEQQNTGNDPAADAVQDPVSVETEVEAENGEDDAGNGAGGFYAEKVLKPLGACTEGSQFLDPDGSFPNHIPNPEDIHADVFGIFLSL